VALAEAMEVASPPTAAAALAEGFLPTAAVAAIFPPATDTENRAGLRGEAKRIFKKTQDDG